MLVMKAMTVNRSMLAGEAAKLLGVGVQTLHFYEHRGLIPFPPRTRSGYRLYTRGIIERLLSIRKAQALGFSLDETKEILGLVSDGASPCGRVQATLAEKLSEVDRRLEELHGFRAELATLVEQASQLSARKPNGQVCSIVQEASPLPVSSLTRPALARRRAVSSENQGMEEIEER